MKAGLNRYRIVILAGLGLLCMLLSLMVTNLLVQLRDLSTAASDNTQWSILQLDTEFANLSAILSDGLADQDLSRSDIQLRIDIVISRADIINTGRAAAIFSQDDSAADLIAPINAFVGLAVTISDRPGPLTEADLQELRLAVQEVRPYVRQAALLGVTLGAANAEARRAEFARQLRRTGGIAIGLLLMMSALLVLLDRLLRRAARSDSELLTSSQLLTSTVAASLDAIVTADEADRIIGFNRSAEDVFGWTREEIIGLTIKDTIIPHRMRDAHHNGMKRYLETRKPRVVDGGRVELAALRKTGEEFPVEINITSIQDDDGIKFIAYLRDISARKINEQRLIDARDRAERTDKAKSQFLTVMSHEMRTPLNGILGVLDLLRTTHLSPKQDHYAKTAIASGEILLEHVNEALDITRIETGTLQLTPQPFALAALVTSVVDTLEPLATEKGLSLALKLDETMKIGFFGDSHRIRQILTNLIGNAIKFTDSGSIVLSVAGIHGPDASSLTFAVIDSGAGIPAEHREQVFEDFVALAHGEGRQSRGDGMGLSISRKIARQMGGDITLDSFLGVGSTFTFNVPLQRRETHAVKPAKKDVPAPLAPCKILIVEDNDISRRVLAEMLSKLGHTVAEAVHGADGVEKAAETSFDIIFMDISMPVMDGIRATRTLRRKDGPNKQSHIVGLTAHGREEYRDDAVAAGMDRFHTKPIRLDALQSIIFDVANAKPLPMQADGTDVLQELLAALGPEKLRGICDKFLLELDALVVTIQDGSLADDPPALAERAHKAKGAAAMLGQTALERLLATLEQDARAGKLGDLAPHALLLGTEAQSARARFEKRLSVA